MNRSDLPWFAIRVKSRCEKMVSELLRSKGYEEFLPLYWSRRLWSDRVKVMGMPLFAGYLFCRFEPTERASILATPGVFLVVGQGRTPIEIESSEIENIRLAIGSGQRVEPCHDLEVGQTVRIEMGPLRGIEGTLLRFKGANHLILGVQILQRAVAVQLDESWVISTKPASPLAKGKQISSTDSNRLTSTGAPAFHPVISS